MEKGCAKLLEFGRRPCQNQISRRKQLHFRAGKEAEYYVWRLDWTNKEWACQSLLLDWQPSTKGLPVPELERRGTEPRKNQGDLRLHVGTEIPATRERGRMFPATWKSRLKMEKDHLLLFVRDPFRRSYKSLNLTRKKAFDPFWNLNNNS